MDTQVDTQRRAAFAVAPICPSIPAAVLILVAILKPWWTTRQDITYYPTNVTQFTVTQSSEISLWGHHGCRLNETWQDICSLPPSECVAPPAPPPGYIPPWTPPPVVEDNTEWRQQLVTGPPNVRITTTVLDRPYRCVSGNCGDGPGLTTTQAPSDWQAPAYAGEGNIAFGDNQARLGDEVVSSNEDAFRIPPTPNPGPTTTPRPTFLPEVGEVDPSVLATNPPSTTWAPSGPFAGFWANVGSGTQSSSVGELAYKQNPELSGQGGSSSGPIPGAQLAVEKCPPYATQYWDPLSPPAGQFICSLYVTCGKMDVVLGCLFVAEGLLCLNILLLVSVGLAGGEMDVPVAYANVCLMPLTLIALIAGLVAAGSAGLDPPVHEMVSAGAVCAILALLLVVAAIVLSCLGLFSHFAITNFISKAEAAARVASDHAQASLEAREEWRLQQDAEKAAKKPLALGWRSKKVQPEEFLALEEKVPEKQPSMETSTASSSGTPRAPLQVSVLAIGDAPSQPEVTTLALPHVSLPVRSAEEVAPSPGTEKCMRSFISSPEGAVYAQRFGQPSAPPSALPSAREAQWVAKTSRSSGMTYYVNAETGETRWTPPASPQEAWSKAEQQATGEWKKKRLKNGTVISVRA